MQSALGTIEHHENIVNLHLSLESFKTSLEILGFFLFERKSEKEMKEKATNSQPFEQFSTKLTAQLRANESRYATSLLRTSGIQIDVQANGRKGT